LTGMVGRRWTGLVVCVFVAAACSFEDKPIGRLDDGGSTGSTAEASSGSSTGDGESQTSTTEDAPQCEIPEQEPLGGGVTITITNMRTAPVYLDGTVGCESVPGFAIIPVGSDEALDIDPGCFLASCPALLAGADCGCPLGCPFDNVVRLDPGVSERRQWSGGVVVPVELADGCGSPTCGDECMVLEPPAAGDYRLVLPASNSLGSCAVEPCECPAEELPCTVSGYRGPDDANVEIVFAYPEMNELEIVFD
jgi:hypothetical protein